MRLFMSFYVHIWYIFRPYGLLWILWLDHPTSFAFPRCITLFGKPLVEYLMKDKHANTIMAQGKQIGDGSILMVQCLAITKCDRNSKSWSPNDYYRYRLSGGCLFRLDLNICSKGVSILCKTLEGYFLFLKPLE